jgi:alpha-L-fucosidase
VSKNGNLLLGIAPDASGVFPEMQTKRILEIGAWLSTNGEAIYDTKPWSRPSGSTMDGLPVRYTSTDAALYAIVLDEPASAQLTIAGLAASPDAEVRLLGHDAPLTWEQSGGNLAATLPERRPPHALALKITPKP